MDIDYRVAQPLTVEQFIDLLHRSGLAERRPVGDIACIQGMLDRADLCITAWRGEQVVGIARSVTDFHYCCYLSDLAVDVACQRQGVGRRLQQLTLEQLAPTCKLILVAAPAADDYYGRFGFERNPRCGQPVGLRIDLLRRRKIGPYFRVFSAHRHHYVPQKRENLDSISHSPRYDHLSPTGCWILPNRSAFR